MDMCEQGEGEQPYVQYYLWLNKNRQARDTLMLGSVFVPWVQSLGEGERTCG